MKKILLVLAIGVSTFVQAQLNNRRLVVPEFGNNVVKTYVPTSATTMAVDPAFTITFNTLGNGLATAASPNCTAMFGSDLYVSLTVANQRIYKFPNYGTNPATAIANVSQVAGAGASDFVGIAFDASGNLYASEGSFLNTQIVKYSGINLATRTVLGNGGGQSYFGNIAFDASGNLWASDYYQNRLVVIPVASLSTVNAPMKSLVNAPAVWNASGASLANTNAALSANAVNYAFTSPEGVAFDSTGGLWVANNNDANSQGGLLNTSNATLVRISPALQAIILGATTTIATTSLLNNVNGLKVWNVPNSASGRCQLGGMQIDKVTDRLYVNEQKSNSGLFFDISSINAINTTFATYQLNMVSTSSGNGGIYLASNTQVLGNESFENNSVKMSFYPNPSNGNFDITASEKIETASAFDVLGKEIGIEKVSENNFKLSNPISGIYFVKVFFSNGSQTTKKLVVD
jgi:Secretion system C-terminal sorting domain